MKSVNMTKSPQGNQSETPPKVRELDYDKAEHEMAELIATRQSLVLSTTDSRGNPEASYAPFISDEAGCFYIYVSALARHSSNLKKAARVSFMLIEDEAEAASIYARKRLTLTCESQLVDRESEAFGPLMDQFIERFGAVMKQLAGMKDFQLFRFKPIAGRLVLGFGAAFKVTGLQLERHLKGQHQTGK